MARMIVGLIGINPDLISSRTIPMIDSMTIAISRRFQLQCARQTSHLVLFLLTITKSKTKTLPQCLVDVLISICNWSDIQRVYGDQDKQLSSFTQINFYRAV